MNTVIMCHVHYLSKEMEGKTYKEHLKVHLEILTKLLLQYNYRMSKIPTWFEQILLSDMAKILQSQLLNCYHRWPHYHSWLTGRSLLPYHQWFVLSLASDFSSYCLPLHPLMSSCCHSYTYISWCTALVYKEVRYILCVITREIRCFLCCSAVMREVKHVVLLTWNVRYFLCIAYTLGWCMCSWAMKWKQYTLGLLGIV